MNPSKESTVGGDIERMCMCECMYVCVYLCVRVCP